MDLDKKYVFLLEDDNHLRSDLEAALQLTDYVVHSYSRPDQFLHELDAVKALAPAVFVTDMRMPKISGVDLQAEIRSRDHKIPIIFISGESTDQQIVRAFRDGAFDFLLKPFSVEVFLSTINRALELEAAESQKRDDQNTVSEILKILTPRERQVFDLLAKGYSNGELVEALGIAMPTVKQYKFEVMQKLKLRSVSELIALNDSLIRF